MSPVNIAFLSRVLLDVAFWMASSIFTLIVFTSDFLVFGVKFYELTVLLCLSFVPVVYRYI